MVMNRNNDPSNNKASQLPPVRLKRNKLVYYAKTKNVRNCVNKRLTCNELIISGISGISLILLCFLRSPNFHCFTILLVY